MTPLNTRQKSEILSATSLFQRVPSREIDVLAAMMETELYGADEVVFDEGANADCVYVIATGKLRVEVSGLERAVRTMGPGEVFGEVALFAGGARTATIVSEEESTLLTLDYEPFRAFLRQFPEAWERMVEIVVGRFLDFQRSMVAGE